MYRGARFVLWICYRGTKSRATFFLGLIWVRTKTVRSRTCRGDPHFCLRFKSVGGRRKSDYMTWMKGERERAGFSSRFEGSMLVVNPATNYTGSHKTVTRLE